MILGIGTDLLKISRMENRNIGWEDPFYKKAFSLAEMNEAAKREEPSVYLAMRFAGKEAVFKALSPGSMHVDFCEIEILNHEDGKPYVTLYGKLLEYSMRKGIEEIMISLSYDSEYAIAYALLQGPGTNL